MYIPRQKQLDIDGAYFGTSFPHVFLKVSLLAFTKSISLNSAVFICVQSYPELMPLGAPKFIPKIYGFKIFGMRGSKYELKFDYAGKPVNEEEIRKVLRKDDEKMSL